MDNIDEIEKYQKKILGEEKRIEELEKAIEAKEEEILNTESKIFKVVGGLKFIAGGVTGFEAKFLKAGFIRRFQKHKIIYTLTTITSIVLIWRGIWALADTTPGISNPIISIVLGFFILWVIDKITEVV